MTKAILIVDDETPIRRALAKICEKLGYSTLQAWTILGVEEVFVQSKIQLAFVDINLNPDKPNLAEGFDVISWLSAKTPKIFICAMSGRPENEKLARQAGANHFLHKPFEVDEIITLINQFFDSPEASPSS